MEDKDFITSMLAVFLSIAILIGLIILYFVAIKTGIRVLLDIRLTNPQVIWLVVLRILLFPIPSVKKFD